ncbi:hypothetical protein C8A05DRAFT_36532 [Staphylotrichum tortipilum]|uniref:Uncharacterized protein n=1 Tax=Staphylotrichum tortipilum TaxID=2831512 RepID=A0AAN6MGL5_9PEZI|nr:hypothetical protein C8A05DRAFT_36532 [Staphylotrichum longicolle]
MDDADRKTPSIGPLNHRIDSKAASEIFDSDGIDSTKIGVTGAEFLILNNMIGTGIFSTPSSIFAATESVGITGLLTLSGTKYYSILTMVDWLTKWVYFLPYRELWSAEQLADVIYRVVLGIVAAAKDKQTGNIEEELSKASNLALAMNPTMTAWEKAITGYAANLFSGTPESTSLLSDLMSGGALIPSGVPKGSAQPKILTADKMKSLAKRALFMDRNWGNKKGNFTPAREAKGLSCQ